MANEVRVNLTLEGGQLKKMFHDILAETLNDKAIDKALSKRIEEFGKQYLSNLNDIEKYFNTIKKLSDDAFDSGRIEESNAILKITAGLLKQIEREILNLGQMSFSDFVAGLKTFVSSMREAKELMGDLAGSQEAGAPINYKAFDTEGKRQLAEIDQQIALLQKRQEWIEKYKKGQITLEDLSEDQQLINANSNVQDIQGYVFGAANRVTSLNEEKNKLRDDETDAILSGANQDELDKARAAYEAKVQEWKEAQRVFSERIVAVDNLLPTIGESGEKITDQWDALVSKSKEILSKVIEDSNIEQETNDKLKELRKQREDSRAQIVAMKVTGAEDLTPEVISQSQEKPLEDKKTNEKSEKKPESAELSKEKSQNQEVEKQLQEQEKKHEKDINRIEKYKENMDKRYETALEATGEIATPKIETPQIINDLLVETDEQKARLQNLLKDLDELDELGSKVPEKYNNYWQNLDQLPDGTIDQSKIPKKLGDALWYPKSGKNGTPTGPELKYKVGRPISLDSFEKYIGYLKYAKAVESAVDAELIDSVAGVQTNPKATPTDYSGEALKKRLQSISGMPELIKAVRTQVEAKLGILPAQVVEEVAQEAIPQAASTVSSNRTTTSPTSTPASSSSKAPSSTTPSVSIPEGKGGNGGPPNTVYVNVVYKKTRDQMAAEILETLRNLQSLLDKTPLKFAFEDPNGAEGGTLPRIFKALSKNTSHTIEIKVDKGSINSMAAAYHQVQNLANVMQDAYRTLDAADKETLQAFGASLPSSVVAAFTDEQLKSLIGKLSELFESEDGVNYFSELNKSIETLTQSFNGLLQKFQEFNTQANAAEEQVQDVIDTPITSRTDSDAAEGQWINVQNASHKLFKKSSHKDAIGDVTQYKLIDQESDAYKELSEVLFELYERYKALGGVRSLSEIGDDEWYSLNDKVAAPGGADLNKLERDYADRAVRQANGEDIVNQFKELLSILNLLVPKFTELLELYKTINRVADENALASKWSEVQKNMLKIVNSKGEIDYDKEGFTDLAATFYKSYRGYRDSGGTLDFNALRMHDTSKLKPNAYDSFFEDYRNSESFPKQTPLGGINDGVDKFITNLGNGAKEASTNIDLLKDKIKSLEDTLKTSNSISTFFENLSKSLEPAKNYFNELTEKVKSIGTQQQDVKIDTKDLTESYNKLTETLQGVEKSLNSILELYKAINGVASQSALDEQWGKVSEAYNGLLNKKFAIDPNKSKDVFFDLFSQYQKIGGTNQFSDLVRIGAGKSGENLPINTSTADNLGKQYYSYQQDKIRQQVETQQPIAATIDLTTIENTIASIKANISSALGDIKKSIYTLPEALKTGVATGQENLSTTVAQAIGTATNASIIALGHSITQELTEHLTPLLVEALSQARLSTLQLRNNGDNDNLRTRRAALWFGHFSQEQSGEDENGAPAEIPPLIYAEGKYRSNPITLDLGGNLQSLLRLRGGATDVQNQLNNNLSRQGAEELLRIARIYNDLDRNDALGEYTDILRSEEPDYERLRELDNEFEALRVGINNFLKDLDQGRYALSNARGTLRNRTDFVETPEAATAIIRRDLISPQGTPLRWRSIQGGKFSGNFSKEGVWSGTGVDSAGNATKVTYAYDPFNKDIRTLQVDLPKETAKNKRAIDKQKKDFEALRDGFLEDVDKNIAGTRIQDIGVNGQRYSNVLGIVTTKTNELATLRDQIYAALGQDGWDELNSKIALGIVSKTDAEYQRFQNLLDLLDRFEIKTKEVNSLIGSSNSEGWVNNNKGSVLYQGIKNNPTDITQAIENAKKLYDGLTGKLSASGQSFSGQYKDASNQIHDVTIAYNEATQSVRVFEQVNGKATEDLQKRAQEQYDSVKKTLDETNKLSDQKYGGVNFGNLDSLKAASNPIKPVITQEAEAKINEFQQAIAEYQKAFNEAAQNNTDWAAVAQAKSLGNAEPFAHAYDKLKDLLSLSDGLKKLSETIGKILAPDTGSGWLENNNGTLITLPTNANLSPQKAGDTIRDYLENTAGYTSLKGGKHDKQGWHFKGTKNKIEYPITVSYDSNGDLRYLQAELDNTAAKITGLDNLGRQTFDSFKRAIVTLTPLVTVIQSATQAFQNGYNTLVDYDKALTNISYTMTLSKQQLKDLGQATIDMAKDLNLSISDAMSVAQIYANMQTTPEEIVELSRPTAILANLSGQNTETAANYVQSVIEQFGMTEEDAMHIVDVYDTVSANIKMDYAKGIGVIASATEAAGQVAKDAGLSFEQLAAIVAKVAERTREEGSSIGNALKTIITRLSKASQLSGADEVDNETLSKASAALADIGIQVYTSEGEFRSFGTIIGELADKWDSLTDVQQSNLSYQIAATRLT